MHSPLRSRARARACHRALPILLAVAVGAVGLTATARAGEFYEKDGAVWLRFSAVGRPQDRVLVKSSGEPTYRLPDIAYHRDKFARGKGPSCLIRLIR